MIHNGSIVAHAFRRESGCARPSSRPEASPSNPFSTETYIAVLTAAGIALHLGLRYLTHAPRLAWLAPLFVALSVGGVPILVTLVKKLWAREFGSDLLAGISIVAAVLQGEYLVGTIVVLMLSGGRRWKRWRRDARLQCLTSWRNASRKRHTERVTVESWT